MQLQFVHLASFVSLELALASVEAFTFFTGSQVRRSTLPFKPPAGNTGRHGLTTASSHLAASIAANDQCRSELRPEEADNVNDVLTDLLWNAAHVMDPDFLRTSIDPTLRKFHDTLTHAVETGSSTIPAAGLGLFAIRDIKAGEIVTMYPIHTLGINFHSGGSEWVAKSIDDQDYFMRCAEENSPNYSLYLLGNRSPENEHDGIMVVDCNPKRKDEVGWTAHRINDGAIITKNSEAGIVSYLEQSTAKQNCVICPWGPSPLLAAIATTDLDAGEELFTSYGTSYWLEALFEGEEWAEKTEDVREKEAALFERYLYYATTEPHKEVAAALQNVFDSL